ncbi:C4-dicarboxylate ABC transporter substrate-binding protein [Sporosarcina sp. P12(2017)]|uniref:TRAP transporter substrate-binding protein n=2 Tax=unclassified Sporosarcina TaxID=2647733 RepID=UPI000C163CFC|nr:TRAP transporter substrate-binding protein [Sporosarcina sp. P10]PIC55991.1 C4-dicarboxylate ABC transporter substrate-binding protein [Sporosarcina sp. P10]PIC59600.1 C4-dicarboxylate ABC transporter substrate-binding protein [Sporosarcina sp. P12(2017)]
MRRLLISMSLVLLVMIMSACGGNEEKASAGKNDDVIKLSYAFFAPPNTFPAIQMEEWKKRLEERTDGKVQVDLFTGGTLLEANNMYDGVENGTADIGLTSTSYEPGRFPLLSISDMPSGYKNATVASKVTADLVNNYPPEALDNFKIITTFATEPAYIQSKKPIKSLSDLKGKQLRIAGALAPIMSELGAAPVGMSQAEVPEALQTGIVEGYVSSREILKDSKLAEIVGYVTDYPLALNTFIAVMNKEKWDSLPEDVQAVIEELNTEMTEFTGDYLDSHVKESMEWSIDSEGLEVVELSEEEMKKWDKKLSDMQKEFVEEVQNEGLPAEEYLSEMEELIEKYNNAD